MLRHQSLFVGSNDKGGLLSSTKRVHESIYLLVSNNYASYYDLKYNYDIDDFINLYEICIVNLYNKTMMLNGGK